MANMLMMRYAASRGENGSNDRTDSYERSMESYGGNGMTYREPMQQPARDEYGNGAESRYRGKDGRWKAGRRSEYESGAMNYDTENRRMGGDDEEEGRKYKIEVLPSNVIRMPERKDGMTEYPAGRQIGFGAQNSMSHSRSMKDEEFMGGYNVREHNGMEFDRETAEHWVRSMRNEDKAHPVGGKWTPDMLKPLAQKYGIPTDGPRFWEFYAMTNAMYSDYGEVARKFGITSPEFYVCMAKAWMEDKDAEQDKTALYYEYIVKKE